MDSWIVSRVRERGVSLEALRECLKECVRAQQAQLAELVRALYADFVALSAQLVAADRLLMALETPFTRLAHLLQVRTPRSLIVHFFSSSVVGYSTSSLSLMAQVDHLY